MKYIIMADGKGTRWQNYNDIPKHFIRINGETILERTVRLLNEHDSGPYACEEVIITSHDERYEVHGARRYEPKNNVLEVDRFTRELIDDEICFLYGDTYYTDSAVDLIVNTEVDDVMFFGNQKSIVAVKVKDGEVFRKHFEHIRNEFLANKIENCKGWQVYHSYAGLKLDGKEIGKSFVIIDDNTDDFNTPEEFRARGLE